MMEKKNKLIITGSQSFIGRNLKAELKNRNIFIDYIIDNSENLEGLLLKLSIDTDVEYTVIHLLTEYRSVDIEKFNEINVEFTKNLLYKFENTKTRFIMISTEQAGNGTPYGNSKMLAEKLVTEWSSSTGNEYSIIRLANEFGKWCPPNFNSVIATFCNNIANGEKIVINKPETPLRLMYIDDIINTIFHAATDRTIKEYINIIPVYMSTVGEIAELIKNIDNERDSIEISALEDDLTKRLYSTYLSYLPEKDFGIELNMHTDIRGSFTEMFHFDSRGQVSINITFPGITKGNHWHHTKTEKFIVVSGKASIKFRLVDSEKIIEYKVSGDKIESIDIPPGYTHNITNVGDDKLITVMWANEIFDPNHPDTYYMEV